MKSLKRPKEETQPFQLHHGGSGQPNDCSLKCIRCASVHTPQAGKLQPSRHRSRKPMRERHTPSFAALEMHQEISISTFPTWAWSKRMLVHVQVPCQHLCNKTRLLIMMARATDERAASPAFGINLIRWLRCSVSLSTAPLLGT